MCKSKTLGIVSQTFDPLLELKQTICYLPSHSRAKRRPAELKIVLNRIWTPNEVKQLVQCFANELNRLGWPLDSAKLIHSAVVNVIQDFQYCRV